MVKTIDLSTDHLYIKQYILSNADMPSVLFIHGGPGLNCATLEYFISQHNYFNTLKYNLIVYDQRGCGRSRKSGNVSHVDNVDDLKSILRFLELKSVPLAAIVGHSYGAKVLFDYEKDSCSNLKCVFVGTAKDIIIPRINNLLLDLNYLKLTNQAKYQEIFSQFHINNVENLWDQTTKLAETFNQNPNRIFYYWANLDIYNLYQECQKVINLPCNLDVFENVRKTLYSNDFELNFEHLKSKYLVINGFHDYVMNGYNEVFSRSDYLKVFPKSGHYPHLEENEKFCEEINYFV